MAATKITTAELADALSTTPRTLRRFLRAEVGKVGKGSRYELPGDARSIKSMAKKFDAWNAADLAARAARTESNDDSNDDATD